MDPEEIMACFESVCPDCGGDVEIISIGGSEQFISEWILGEKVQKTVWRPEADAVGGIEWKCQSKDCGHTFYFEKLKGGDWA